MSKDKPESSPVTTVNEDGQCCRQSESPVDRDESHVENSKVYSFTVQARWSATDYRSFPHAAEGKMNNEQ